MDNQEKILQRIFPFITLEYLKKHIEDNTLIGTLTFLTDKFPTNYLKIIQKERSSNLDSQFCNKIYSSVNTSRIELCKKYNISYVEELEIDILDEIENNIPFETKYCDFYPDRFDTKITNYSYEYFDDTEDDNENSSNDEYLNDSDIYCDNWFDVVSKSPTEILTEITNISDSEICNYLDQDNMCSLTSSKSSVSFSNPLESFFPKSFILLENECDCCFQDIQNNLEYQCSEGHKFCKSCFNKYLESKIFNGDTRIKCFSTNYCIGKFTDQLIKENLSSQKYTIYKENLLINLMSSKKFKNNTTKCYFCNSVVISADCKILECLRCNHLTCVKCQQEASEFHECQKYENLNKCPQCKRSIIKESKELVCNKLICGCGCIICNICNLDITEKREKHFKYCSVENPYKNNIK